MTKYIIKATMLEGEHKGDTYYLDKKGYVRENLDSIWQEDAYTLSACKAACTRKYKANTAEHIAEKREREYAIAHGKRVSRYPIYEMESYEPFAIETVDG